MPDSEQNKQSDFMIEKIKDRPINKKKLLRRTVTTAAMAVIFGLIACLTFLILEPVFSNWLYPEEEPQTVVFPEEADEMAPEDMLVEEEEQVSLQEAVESVISEDEQIQKILDNIQLDKTHYVQLYEAMADYTKELSYSMVTVTAMTSDVDWLNDTYESEGQTYGVIVASNGKEYLILTDRNTIKQAESITVTFCDGTKSDAVIKQMDSQTGLAVVSVPIVQMAESTRKEVKVASLGSSNGKNMVGTPVVALGCPMVTVGSVEYGMIAATGSTLYKVDANYRLLLTDMYGSSNSTGVLFNMHGQIIGIITANNVSTDMKNNITAIGISDLRKLIENMSNGKEPAYMGISGMDVTVEANQEMSVPFGAYVREVAMDSPAMLGGIQPGDVIVEIGGSSIDNFSNYTSELLRLQAGQTVTVVVQRLVQDSYKEMEMEITLGTAK
ncbi:MAG: S1C family serine protease [Lachnospiraceae bacterium]